ncbi:FHA domain-containing protein [Actinomycetospora chiangmaiensis]|uniref:FHA domain-containing protein n=1 Tax=Actinomycetospora chiangmaiensis TaxID=402650 RepID=UPI0003609421|nr:FHA domain-containing protein [Actinomycetospora chiangmaiensis]
MTAPPCLLRVGVERGEGLVARYGDVVVLVVGEEEQAERLVDAVETAAAGGSAGRIAAALAQWVAGRPDPDPVAFGLVVPVPDGLVVLLRGEVWCEVVQGATTMTSTGRETSTWVDRLVPEPVHRVTVGSGAARALRATRRSDLSGGVVPGAGFVRECADGEYADPPADAAVVPDVGPPVPPAVAAAPSSSPPVPARGPSTGDSAAAVKAEAPAPSAARAVPTAAAAPGPDTGHAPAGGPARETAAAPLPIGVLRCDEGPTVLLDRSYVLGRDPQNEPAVRAGRATPITVSDPTNLVSRVHAFVSVDDGVVVVRDASTVSGTYLAEPGAESWTRVGTGPTELPPGWHLRIGMKVFVHEPTAHTAS